MTAEDAILTALSPDAGMRAHLSGCPDSLWQQILTLAERHRIRPQLLQTVRDRHIPAEAHQALQAFAAEAAKHNLQLTGELKRIQQAWHEAGIPAVPFKGPLLAERLTGQLANRECYDIDLLIREQHLQDASAILSKLGYADDDEATPGHQERWQDYRYEQGFVHGTTGVRVEIHWRVMPAFFPLELEFNDLLAEAEMDATLSVPHLRFNDELLFFLLALHAARHCFEELCWVNDLAQISAHDGFSWDTVFEWANKTRTTRLLRLTQEVLRHIPGTQIPPHKISQELLGISQQIRKSWFSQEEVPLYPLLASCREDARDRITMYWRLIFQPTEADLTWIDLPGFMDWAYPAVRSLRLIKSKTRKR